MAGSWVALRSGRFLGTVGWLVTVALAVLSLSLVVSQIMGT